MKIRGLIVLLLVALSTSSQHISEPVFSHILPEQIGVNVIAYQCFDNNGRLWATTDKGLIVFDGYTTEFISSNGSDQSPLSNNIRTLQKLRENEFWLTYNDNMNISSFDPIQMTFKHYLADSMKQHALPYQMTVKLVDENDSIRWVLSWGNGISRLNISNGYVTQYTNELMKVTHDLANTTPDIIPSNFVKEFIKISKHEYLVGFFQEYTKSTPYIFNSETGIFKPVDFQPYLDNTDETIHEHIKKSLSIIHFIYVDDDKNFWCGTYTGLLFIDNKNYTISRITHKSNNIIQQNLDNTKNYVVDENKNLWIATPNQGIMFVNTQTKEVQYFQKNIAVNSSIADNRIRSLSKDSFGNIWVSTESGTMSIYHPQKQKFQVHAWSDIGLAYTNRSEQTVPVNQILVLENGHILISDANGITEYDANNYKVLNQFEVAMPQEQLKNLDYKKITHFRKVGNLIYFISGHAIQRRIKFSVLDFSSGKISTLAGKSSFAKVNILFRHLRNDMDIYATMATPKGNYLIKYNQLQNQFDTVTQFIPYNLISEKFSLILPSKNWLLPTDNGKLIYYLPAENKYQIGSKDSGDFYFPDSSSNCAIVDNKNQIWVGTNNGLYLFNEKTKEFQKRNFQINLQESEKVSSMIQDKNGVYWIALTKDLIRWDKEKNEVFRYNQSHGLNIGNFLPAVAQIDDKGFIYIATYNGILVFDPASLSMPQYEFKIELGKAEVSGENISTEDLLTKNLTFNYDQNFLNLEFYLNQVYAIQPHQFYYRLVGRDNDWIDNGASNKVRLSDLNYGEYQLQVKAVNGYYQESNIVSIPFIILKPFYLRWWFLTLVLIFVITLVWLYIKYREKALRKRSDELETIVKERTAEAVQEKQEADKQRLIAEHQKEIVEEKQKEIADSIAYAKRIQNAILPSLHYFRKNLPESFIFYLPKDVVAGDFYWMETVKNDEGEFIILAVADCTGHGVPGAMVSVVCHNALTRAVNEFNLFYPHQILDKTRELVIETFSNNDEQVNDGMDISLISINLSKNTIYYSGANNGLLLIRDNELQEIKADKQPIGNFIFAKPFNLQTIHFKKGDQIYLYSDGYADQFGGEAGKPGGKKFKFSRLKTLFTEICKNDLQKQREILENTLHQWRGEIEQIDDICIIGVKL